MHNALESIVPSLNLCLRIPGIHFLDSALCWLFIDAGNPMFAKCHDRRDAIIERERNHDFLIAPAPTLREIMDEIRKMTIPKNDKFGGSEVIIGAVNRGYFAATKGQFGASEPYESQKAEDAALELFFTKCRIKGIIV